MPAATTFERTVYVADYHARRALAAGRRADGPTLARHRTIMNALIEGSDFPDMAREELTAMLGRSRAAVLKLDRPVLVLA